MTAYCQVCRAPMRPAPDRDGWWLCVAADCHAHGVPRPEGMTAARPHRGKAPTASPTADLRPRRWRNMPRSSARPQVLVINGYAGSLVIAARSIGCDVVGSYEDAGYGLDAQRLNFHDLPFAGSRRFWPDDDLRGVVVIAHPPCAGFSTQNRTANRGTESTAFKETEEVLTYALERNADAVLVESVVLTMEGARDIHDRFGNRYGYRLYRVLQNAATFGVPQWRPRFWAVFVRDGLLPERVWFHHEPRRRTIGDILQAQPGRPIRAVEGLIARQREVLRGEFGGEVADRILKGEFGHGRIDRVVARLQGVPRVDEETTIRLCLSKYGTNLVRIFGSESVAPVLLHYAQWVYRGRPLSSVEYRRVMGYPDDYRFPTDDPRKLLSKGVCPPVAAWLLDQVLAWVEGRTPPLRSTWTQPGDVVDLQPRSCRPRRSVWTGSDAHPIIVNGTL